jgi:hypothetical protein
MRLCVSPIRKRFSEPGVALLIAEEIFEIARKLYKAFKN